MRSFPGSMVGLSTYRCAIDQEGKVPDILVQPRKG